MTKNKTSKLHPAASRKQHWLPDTAAERLHLRRAVAEYMAATELVPPLSMDELRLHAENICRKINNPESLDYLMVLLGSAVWHDTLAAIPYERRLLLLPQCLRSSNHCKAAADAYGLLCARCGKCAIGRIEEAAEALGYMVLIAEGTTFVTQLLKQRRIDAVIGVGCLDALEQSFPHLAAEAIPGMAVPLINAGCVDTQVEVEQVLEILHLFSPAETPGFDIEALRNTVETWFQPQALLEMLGSNSAQPLALARDWLGRAGKRWRPFLTTAAWQALRPGEDTIPHAVKCLAAAVECFHKASLIHDDIEDNDDSRYGLPALHAEAGIPVAINVGDLLIGEGYRLISASGLSSELQSITLAVAAQGHRNLAVGQGEELAWCRNPHPFEPEWIIEVFRGKTAPAFSVALHFGAICAGEPETGIALENFSAAMGIAYQIKDDLDDFQPLPPKPELERKLQRPSIITALAFKLADDSVRLEILRGWRKHCFDAETLCTFTKLTTDKRVLSRAELLLDHYCNEAVRALSPLRSAQLKTLLRRLVGRMLNPETAHVSEE